MTGAHMQPTVIRTPNSLQVSGLARTIPAIIATGLSILIAHIATITPSITLDVFIVYLSLRRYVLSSAKTDSIPLAC